MFRRVVTFLLMSCMLVSQASAFGRAHAAGHFATAHDRPHVHLGTNDDADSTKASHEHGHAHSRHGHAHRDHDEAPASPALELPFEHDADAVFVADVDLANLKPSNDVPTAQPAALPPSLSDVALLFASVSQPQVNRAPSDGRRASTRPLYVRYCAFLI